jgi:hypothetical protein
MCADKFSLSEYCENLRLQLGISQLRAQIKARRRTAMADPLETRNRSPMTSANLDGAGIASFYASLVGLSKSASMPDREAENATDVFENMESSDRFRSSTAHPAEGQPSRLPNGREKGKKEGRTYTRLESHNHASTSGRRSSQASQRKEEVRDASKLKQQPERGEFVAQEKLGLRECMKQGTQTGTLEAANFSDIRSSAQLNPNEEIRVQGIRLLHKSGAGHAPEKAPAYQLKIPSGNIGY